MPGASNQALEGGAGQMILCATVCGVPQAVAHGRQPPDLPGRLVRACTQE